MTPGSVPTSSERCVSLQKQIQKRWKVQTGETAGHPQDQRTRREPPSGQRDKGKDGDGPFPSLSPASLLSGGQGEAMGEPLSGGRSGDKGLGGLSRVGSSRLQTPMSSLIPVRLSSGLSDRPPQLEQERRF